MKDRFIVPTDYQNAILSVPETINLMLCGGRGGGKAVSLDTPLPTPQGWISMGDIRQGDTVFDENGQPCSVLATYDRTPKKAYRVTFSDGTYIDACDEHEWVTYNIDEWLAYIRTSTPGPLRGWADNPKPRTTQDIVDTLQTKSRGKKHRIPLCAPLETPEIELPLEPYLLGIWLGDGHKDDARFASMDPEIVRAFTDAGYVLTVDKSTANKKAKTYQIGPVETTYTRRDGKRSKWARGLVELGVWGNKHVPPQYLRASKEQRLSLLQGLMDSDGSCGRTNGQASFSVMLENLADGVVELARSLGQKPVKTVGTAKLYGKIYGNVYHVTWTPTIPCFRLPRKLERIHRVGDSQQWSRNFMRTVSSCAEIPCVPMRCITVDSPNHMYLAGEGMVPTHNSYAIMFLLLRHAQQYAEKAYALLVRESYEAIKQLEEDFDLLLSQVFQGRVRHNKTEHTFYFPNGAKVQFAQLGDARDFGKFQGKSYTLLVVDEYGGISDIKWVTMLMSSLRGDKSVPTRSVFAANPGGPQHGHIHYDFIAKASPWTKFEHRGQNWAVCPSTWRDNNHIDQAAYLKQLKASCGNDEDLFKAWDSGDWNIARGAYFAGALDENIHRIPNSVLPVQKLNKPWNLSIGLDWGSGAPSVCYVGAESPGVRHFPKGSLVICDELATCDPNDLNQGLNWPPSKLADAIKDMCAPWGCPPEGVSDDSYGLQDTLIEKLEEYGVFVHRPDKARVAGWQLMRQMLVNAKERNGKPGLWISERCTYFWKTVPFLQRDIKRPEDILTTGPDHGADAARYLCMEVGKYAFHGGIVGNY